MKKLLAIYFAVEILLAAAYLTLLGAAFVKEKTETAWGIEVRLAPCVWEISILRP